MGSGWKGRMGDLRRAGVLGSWRRSRIFTIVGALALVGVFMLPVQSARAELSGGAQADESSFWEGVGLGAGAAVANLAYMPAKLIYAAAGGAVGGLAYLVTFGSTETANAIWEPTLGGTYVLTPKMLAGEEKLHFNGQPAIPSEPAYRDQDGGWSR